MRRVGVAAVLIAGCAQQQERYLPAERPAERGILFSEIGRDGEPKDKSGAETSPRRATKVPQPAFLDVDSTLHIEVRPTQLVPASERSLAAEIESTDELEETLTGVLGTIREVQTLEAKTLEEFARTEAGQESEGALDRFVAARRAFGSAEEQLIDTLLENWAGTPLENELEDAAEEDDAWAGVAGFVQRRVDALDARNGELWAQLRTRELALTLEAWLDSPDGKRKNVHVAGYDSLEAGDVRLFDRTGLALNDEERQGLADRFAKTSQIAESLEAVNRGEADLREALKQLGPIFAPDLRSAIDDLLAATEDEEQFRADVRLLRDELPELANAVAARAGQAAAEGLQRLGPELQSDLGVDALILDAASIARDFRSLAPREIVDFVARVARLVESSRDLTDRISRGKLADGSDLSGWIESKLSGLGPQARDAALAEIADDRWEGLRESLDRVRSAAVATRRLVEFAASLGRAALPVQRNLDPPKSQAVPLDEVRDTFIDLTRTPRSPGDRAVVRTTLFKAGEEYDRSEASFGIESFGWSASLSPAVVLVRADSSGGGANRFAFAPSLSWMHGYRPRPTADDWTDGVARALRPAAGIHAIFLNFDSDKEVEIGLGATVSFWGNRLQGGVGYNLMSEDGVGDVYYFVGSDLISLLQDVGIAE